MTFRTNMRSLSNSKRRSFPDIKNHGHPDHTCRSYRASNGPLLTGWPNILHYRPKDGERHLIWNQGRRSSCQMNSDRLWRMAVWWLAHAGMFPWHHWTTEAMRAGSHSFPPPPPPPPKKKEKKKKRKHASSLSSHFLRWRAPKNHVIHRQPAQARRCKYLRAR